MTAAPLPEQYPPNPPRRTAPCHAVALCVRFDYRLESFFGQSPELILSFTNPLHFHARPSPALRLTFEPVAYFLPGELFFFDRAEAEVATLVFGALRLGVVCRAGAFKDLAPLLRCRLGWLGVLLCFCTLERTLLLGCI